MAMTKFLADSVTKSVFTLKLSQSLFLVKLQAFTMDGNKQFFSGFCDGICLYFKAVTKSVFIKVSDLYYE